MLKYQKIHLRNLNIRNKDNKHKSIRKLIISKIEEWNNQKQENNNKKGIKQSSQFDKRLKQDHNSLIN